MRAGPRLLAVGILVAAGVAPAAPAAAAACAEGAGVTVVVDFASLGGGTDTDCAAGDPSSGLEALRAAGHEPTRAAQQPGYFVCRIDGKPAGDPCQRTSPADAYWSYWYAEPGGSWTFSDTGAADRDPAPGTVEGWAFGAGDPPSSPPPRNRSAAAPAPSPSRAATSPAPVAPRSPVAASPAVSSSPGSPAAPAVSSPSASSSPSAAPTPSATSVRPSPSSSPTPGAAAADRVDDEDSGSLAGPIAALGVVLLLGAAGAYQVQQRRTRDAA